MRDLGRKEQAPARVAVPCRAIRSRRSIVSAAPTSKPISTLLQTDQSRQDAGAILEVTANFRSQKRNHQARQSPALKICIFQDRRSPDTCPWRRQFLITGAYPVSCVSRFTVEVHRADGRIYAEMFREAEAGRVAEICARLIGNVTITRADKSQSRPLKPGDIALLSPGHTELWWYEHALEQRGLAVSSQPGQEL